MEALQSLGVMPMYKTEKKGHVLHHLSLLSRLLMSKSNQSSASERNPESQLISIDRSSPSLLSFLSFKREKRKKKEERRRERHRQRERRDSRQFSYF